jgi:TfoX/Sxy family transcriptional regulator of competence genes
VKRSSRAIQPNRPKLPPISDEMKAWSSALENEVSTWPQVTTKSFFGFTALYRKDFMFAVLPRTRSLETASAIAVRLETRSKAIQTRLENDPRVTSAPMESERWFAFHLSSDRDLHDALDWIGLAYEAAGKKKKS